MSQQDRTSESASDATHVEFLGVEKTYDGETLVVHDLNLKIAKGEFVTFLGPSGSGKTTTLMMLAGFEPLTRGQIRLGGTEIQDMPANRRGIGMVFQNYALFPHMTIQENIAFPLRVRRRSAGEIRAKVENALRMVRLEGFGSRRPRQLSGGQQQRVALARALVFGPELVLMDEPLGALDRALREQMQYEIKHLHEELGITIVYVTHDQGEALTMSTRVAVFNAGRIQQVGTPDEIYETPMTAFVSGFVGENNILTGTVAELEGSECRVRLATGDMVTANAVNVLRTGQKTHLSLRPERVEIDPDPARHANIFPASVEETIYFGDHVRVRAKICGNENFILKVSNTKERRTFRRGEALRLGWSASDCRALDAPE